MYLPIYFGRAEIICLQTPHTALTYDQCQTQKYYEVPHGDGHRGVDGRRFAVPVKSTACFPSLRERHHVFHTYIGCIHGILFKALKRGCHAKGKVLALSLEQSCN